MANSILIYPHRLRFVTSFSALPFLVWFFLPLLQGILLLLVNLLYARVLPAMHRLILQIFFLLLFLNNQIVVWVFFKETFNTVEILIGF